MQNPAAYRMALNLFDQDGLAGSPSIFSENKVEWLARDTLVATSFSLS